MRKIISLVVVVVALVIGYNLYFGTPEEKANAREIVDEVKNIGKASWDLLKSEKEKMEAGKYDDAADKIKGIFERLKGIARDNDDQDQLVKLDDLEQKRLEIERRLAELDRQKDVSTRSISQAPTSAQEESIKRDLRRLYEETESLMKDIAPQ